MWSMSDRTLADVLVELEEQWRRTVPRLVEVLLSGAAEAELDAVEEQCRLRLPHEPRTWWWWHNGSGRTTRPGRTRSAGHGRSG